MDISYWKHFVSKQEHILEQVTTQKNRNAERNAQLYKDCLKERHATNTQITQVQQTIRTLEMRQEVVEEGIVTSTKQLLEARQKLHQEKLNVNANAKNAVTATATATACNAATTKTK